MKKHFFLIASLAFALASCDNSFDIGKIDNEIDLVPGAKIPFPEGTELHYSKTADEITGINGPVVIKESGEVSVTAGEIAKGYPVQEPIGVSTTTVPEAYKSQDSAIKFDDAEVIIGITNPADVPVNVEGEVKIGDTRMPVEFTLDASTAEQSVSLKFDDRIERIPEVIEFQNVRLSTGGTKAAVANGGSDLVFKWNMSVAIQPEFKPGSVLQFTYAFEDLAFDLTSLTVDVKAIEIKAKMSSTFPVSISGNAANSGNGVRMSLSKIKAQTANQDVTLRASSDKSVNTLRDLKVVITAVNESNSTVSLDDKCKLDIDLESIVLPDGFKL